METQTIVSQLSVEFAVLTPTIKHADELEVRAIFRNMGNGKLRINALHLDIPIILLEMRKAGGKNVPFGPPPLPPDDDGVVGRIDLNPKQFQRYVYYGDDLFGGESLPSGPYEIRLRYDNSHGRGDEWKGVIETDWIGFQIEGL
jgi:hypothetical protein